MEKRSFIANRFKKILNETLENRANEILEKLNLNKEVPFSKPGKSFDYVQEREICSECGGYKGGEVMEGDMCECGSMNEELRGGQRKLDVAKPYGKLTKTDFQQLRKGIRKHMEEKSECLECGSKNEFMELGGMDDGHPRFGNKNLSRMSKREKEDLMSDRDYEDIKSKHSYDFDDDFEEDDLDFETDWTQIEEDENLMEYTMGDDELETVKPYGDFSTDSPKIKPGKNKVKNVGDKYQRKVSKQFDDYELDEEMGEGNAFTEKLRRTPKGGKFNMGNKTYTDNSSLEETRYRIGTNGEYAIFTENEVIDMIEKIVKEEKNNLKIVTQPKGMTEYERVHKADKKEEDQYFKELRKKMEDYTKNMSDKGSKYEMKETQKFPTGNGGVKKKYTPSEAVDDYNDAFSYPGQTNLRYEIKPNDEWMEANLVGSSKTGNAQVDEDGNALGNVVPSEVGEKFLNNYKNNYYGDEQANASYKRQTQPIEQAGEHTESGSLKSKKGKKTAQSILNKVDESVEPKKVGKLNEEFNRMQALMGYNRKTQ